MSRPYVKSPSLNNAVVTGASGQLGTAFRDQVPDATFLGRLDVDLGDPESLTAVLDEMGPSLLINCAAYTAVDKAEEDEARATVVNGAAVGVMAEYCHARNVPFVTYSTDYVFGGHSERPWIETDATSPINAYGRSKLAGERLALQADALVIRTSWLVSATHPNFVATMLRLAPTRSFSVVDDQRGCPTTATDLAAATMAAVDAGATGLLHLTNTGETTWYEFAREALELAGIGVDQIEACASSNYSTPAERPEYSVLGSVRRQSLGIDPLPYWRDSLPSVVKGLYDNGVVRPP